MEPKLRFGVVGSRNFKDYEYLKRELDFYEDSIVQIVSGGAKGADSLAERYAKEKKIPFMEFPADWDRYGKSAGYHRNVQIVQASDCIIAFWDGISKGTKHTIEIAKTLGKPTLVKKF